MRQLLRVTGPASADEVWDRYIRPSRWPEWSPQVRGVDYPGELLSPNSAGAVHGPLGLRVGFDVRTVDPASRRWSWAVRVGPIRLNLEHSVSSAGAGASTGLVIDGPAAVVLGYLPIAQLALSRLVRR